MIHAYLLKGSVLTQYTIDANNADLLKKAIWIDLLNLSVEEEHLVEAAVKLSIPTRDDMQEIEISSRLYKENNALFMTASMLINSESKKPFLDAVSFILTRQFIAEGQLITVRYVEPQTFQLFMTQIAKNEINVGNAAKILIALLETSVDRIADIAERVGDSIDEHSQIIFRNQVNPKAKINFRQILQGIGSNGDLAAKVRESLIAFNRLVSYFKQNDKQAFDADDDLHFAALTADIQALSDHVSFLSSQISFLLNATLGMINIDQTNIIKILSVAAVIFLPPAVVAGIYGMNFKYMPELEWHYGFSIAVAVMILSAYIPYQIFKWKKWM